ncbi:MAG: hypothetical protein M3Y32_02075 [Pseudomonadota bacterium]|nr:hypothetical protein [Pseudomonadota bacterium]
MWLKLRCPLPANEVFRHQPNSAAAYCGRANAGFTVWLPFDMSSKSSLWQASWQIDTLAGTAAHDGGLRVRMVDGRGMAENAPEVIESLEPAHGSHNAGAMVRRLVREGEQLLIDPNSRGWRGKERRL